MINENHGALTVDSEVARKFDDDQAIAEARMFVTVRKWAEGLFDPPGSAELYAPRPITILMTIFVELTKNGVEFQMEGP